MSVVIQSASIFSASTISSPIWEVSSCDDDVELATNADDQMQVEHLDEQDPFEGDAYAAD